MVKILILQMLTVLILLSRLGINSSLTEYSGSINLFVNSSKSMAFHFVDFF